MGELADRLDRMVIRETSPDGQIMATQTNRSQVVLVIHPGAYRAYDEQMLASELTELARKMRARCRSGYYEAVSAVTGECVTGEEPEPSSRYEAFRRARQSLQVQATSPNGWITAVTVGLDRWRISIRHGALDALSLDQFIADALSVLRELLTEHADRVHELRDQHFDLNLPEGTRRATHR